MFAPIGGLIGLLVAVMLLTLLPAGTNLGLAFMLGAACGLAGYLIGEAAGRSRR